MVITVENFAKICRLCLSEKSDLIKFYHQTDVIKRLSEITSVKVHRNDDLPKLICDLCLCQLNTSYTFKKLCETSDAELRKFLSERQEEKFIPKEETGVGSRENSVDWSISETSSEPVGADHPPALQFQRMHDGAENFQEDEASEDAGDEQNRSSETKRRKMCCLYCKKYVDSLPKHLVTVHQDEDDVIEFQKYPSRSRKRLSIIALIRRQGNYNAHLEEKNANNEPEKQASPVEYFPCTNCLGYYSKTMLMNHMRNCQNKSVSSRHGGVTPTTNTASSKLSASKILATCILPLIRSDSVLKQIKSDPLILMYGSELCIRNDIKRNSVKIRIKKLIRQISRLLLAMKKANSGITQLMDIFDAKYIDIVMAAVDDIAEYNSETNTYTKYNLAAGLGAGLRKCANIVIANAIIRGNEMLRSTVVNYLKLFDVKFGKKFRNSGKKIKRKVRSVERDPLDVVYDKSPKVEQSAEMQTPINIIGGDQNLLVVKQELLARDPLESTNEDIRKVEHPEDSDAESMSSLPTTLSENEEDSVGSDKEKSPKKKRKNNEEELPSSSKKKQPRRSWSTLEQLTVRKHFSDFIEMGTYPTKQQVVCCLSEEPCLKSRTWQQVKAWISNQHRTLKRDLSKAMVEVGQL